MATWFSQLTQVLSKSLGASRVPIGNTGDLEEHEVAELMERYYFNNALYDSLSSADQASGVWREAMKPMRNPTYAAVEFYAITIWPGALPDALPIVTENLALEDPINQIWKWSNWGTKKQVVIRQMATTGDGFIQVSTNADQTKVYLTAKKARNVTQLEVDVQGHVDYLQYETWKRTKENGRVQAHYRTEVYAQGIEGLTDDEGAPIPTDNATLRVYEHDRGKGQPVSDLGDPIKTIDLKVEFVPWVHIPFIDIGEDSGRGLPVIMPVLDKIDEVNRKATRLSQLMYRFNKAIWAVMANATDVAGRPLPAPKLDATGTIDLEDDQLIRIPGMAELKSLIVTIDYKAYMENIAADLAEINRDLPEALFYQLLQEGDVSGRALMYKMLPAIAKAREVRGQAETGLARADMMALTVGQLFKLEGFESIGNYDSKDPATNFEHTFMERDVLDLALQDKAEMLKTFVESGVPLEIVLKRYLGWDDDDLAGLALPSPNLPVAGQIAGIDSQATATAGAIAPEIQAQLDLIADSAAALVPNEDTVARLAAARVAGGAA